MDTGRPEPAGGSAEHGVSRDGSSSSAPISIRCRRALGPAPTVDKPSPQVSQSILLEDGSHDQPGQAAPLSLSKAGADGDGAGREYLSANCSHGISLI
jgi:hypothetical protein